MKIVIYTDGGARGNPGPAAIGLVFLREGRTLKKYSQSIGQGTNNQAEYEAVIFALKKAKLLFGKKKAKQIEIELRTDSELLTQQLNHCYKIKNQEIQLLFVKVWNLMLDFKEVLFKYVPREENRQADKLVNEALDNEKKVQPLF